MTSRSEVVARGAEKFHRPVFERESLWNENYLLRGELPTCNSCCWLTSFLLNAWLGSITQAKSWALEGCGFHSEGWFRFRFSLYAWPSNITYTLLFKQDKSSTFSSREKQSVGYTLLSAGRLWVPFQRWHILVGSFFFFSQPQEDPLQLFTLCTWQRQTVKTHSGLTVSASIRMQ